MTVGTTPLSGMEMRLFLSKCYASSSHRQLSSSPTFTKSSPRRKRQFIPRKAAVELTDRARTFFKAILTSNPEKDGIILNYQQASSGQPRMVFSFGFVTKDQISPEDEGISLELLEDGTPKSPKDSMNDGLPKLYIHHNAFLKVLGATVDVNTESLSPVLYDREGNMMDPNA